MTQQRTPKPRPAKQLITCPHCGYSVKTKPRFLDGREHRCPRCGRGHTPTRAAA